MAMRDRVRHERDQAAAGAETPDWQTLAESISCEIEAARGGETMRGKKMEPHINAVISMRMRRGLLGVDARDRFVSLSGPTKGKIFNVDSAWPVDRRSKGQPPLLSVACVSAGVVETT